MNSDPYFIYNKYSIYFDQIFRKKVLIELANYLAKSRVKLINSSERDYHFIRNIYEKKYERKNINLFKNNKNLPKQIDKLISNLKTSN